MASNNDASSSTGYPKSSRFSTLRMFKFNGREKPPPPPPKDPYYLQNRSMTSLSPDSLSIPPQSPISPQYLSQYPHRQSPAPSQSTMSLVSSAASQISMTPTDQVAPKKKKSLNFLKFGKRSKSSSRELEPDIPLPSPTPEAIAAAVAARERLKEVGDPGITWPSNFAHNIHVDDGLSGLPPSWAKSLAERGYSEEEIAFINARRMNPRLPQIYAGRPDSPALSNPSAVNQPQSPPYDRSVSPSSNQPSASPILTHPAPRSTSLTRQFSNASMHGRSPHPPPTNPLLPSLATSPSSASLRSIRTNNTSTSSKHTTPPRNMTPSHNPPFSTATISSDLGHQTSPNIPPSVSTVPNTPIRRMQVVNPNTPPPAYSSSRTPPKVTIHQDVKSGSPSSTATSVTCSPVTAPAAVPAISPPLVPLSSHRSHGSVESTTSSQGSRSTGSFSSHSTPQIRRQQSEGLSRPPRLSLHTPLDSDEWSNLVLSLSGEATDGPEPSSSDGTTHSAAVGPPTRPAPVPPIILQGDEDLEANSDSASAQHSRWGEAPAIVTSPPATIGSSPLSSSSPSWHEFKAELEDFVEKDDFREEPLSAALTESFSPTIPRNLSRLTQRDTLRPGPDGTLLVPHGASSRHDGRAEDEFDDDLLGVRRSNRDSSRSSSSTLSASTVTAYTYSTPQIIRNASVVRRAGAYVTKIPGSSGEKPVTQMQVLTEKPFQVENPPMSPMGVGFSANRDSGSSSGSRMQPEVPPSPMNSQFGSDESTGSASSTSSSSQSRDQPTPTTDLGSAGLGVADVDLTSYYINTPSPSRSTFTTPDDSQNPLPSPRDTFGNSPKIVKVVSGSMKVDADDSFVDLGRDDDDFEEQAADKERSEGESDHDGSDSEGTWDTLKGNAVAAILNNPNTTRPVIIVNDEPSPAASIQVQSRLPTLPSTTSLPSTPLTPVQRYPGWLSGVVQPLSPFIDEAIEPRSHYSELQEIAEGESGSIFAARVVSTGADKLRLHPSVQNRDAAELGKGAPVLVAVKIIAITPPSPEAHLPEAQKLIDLERELTLMKGLWHENILGFEALYVDLTEDTLWVRMELMERSLADIVGLVADGLMLQDRMIARFARDVLHALQYLREHRIAHRDVRSDNLLLNGHGVLKLTDFSNAVKLPVESSLRSDPAGVIFWQAPEMRYPNYDALKVDVWSLGATIWEMAETEPPFSDTKQVQSRWPPLTRPEIWSPAFHSFLRACSDSAAVRKSPAELLKDPFVSNACGRGVIVQLLSQCMNIERTIQVSGTS